jgi:hypothetical protein
MICGTDLTTILLFSFLACTRMYHYVDIICAAWNINIHMFLTFLHYVECRCIEHTAWSMSLPLSTFCVMEAVNALQIFVFC